MRKICGVMLLVGALAAATARADTEDARALFEKATVQFRLGQFHQAAETYQRVYELHHDASLLYNCAQAYRLGKEPEKALLFYRSFLSADPDTAQRDEVERRIAELERIIAAQNKENERPPNSVTPTQVPPATTTAAPSTPTDRAKGGRGKMIAGIAIFAVAVGTAAAGVATAVLSGQAADAIRSEQQSNIPFDPAKESAGRTDNVVSGVMFGVAGAAAVVGGTLLVLGIRERRAARQRVSLSPILSPTAVGALVGGSF